MTAPELDLGAVKATAEAATPGPWEFPQTIHGDPFIVEKGKSRFLGGGIAECDRRDDYGRSNAHHIATMDPSMTLALVDRLERAEAEVERLRALADEWEAHSKLFVAPVDLPTRQDWEYVVSSLRSILSAPVQAAAACECEMGWTCSPCRDAGTGYGGRPGLVHWVGELGEGPTSLHGNGAASFARASGDEDEVTCSLCQTLLARRSAEEVGGE